MSIKPISNEIQEAVDAINSANSLFVLTGAGLSVASGLSTYRGSSGVYTDKFKYMDPAEISHINTLKRNPKLFWEFQLSRFNLLDAQPNRGHKAVTELEKFFLEKKKSFFLLTQNIDNLHRMAGSKNLIEIHGNFTTMRCMNPNCGKNSISTRDYFNSHPGTIIPLCPNCNSNLRPNVLLFGETYDTQIIDLVKEKVKKHTDLLFCLGTSFQVVSPVSSLPRVFKAYSENGILIEQNLETTHVTKQFTDIFLKGDADEILDQIIRKIKKTES